jgi:trehalose 2-sulfotransferase
MKPHTSYVICAVQRSGSSLLCEALKNTGLAGFPEEYFLDGHLEDGEWARQNHISTRADYVRLVFDKGTSPNGVFGVKIMWNYFHQVIDKLAVLPGYEGLSAPQLMMEVFPKLHFIWMVRRDKVRQAVSWAKAAQTDIYAWHKGKMPFQKQDPSFDFTFIDNLHQLILEGEAGWQSVFDACGVEPIKVLYEDFIDDYEGTALRILDTLKIPHPKDLKFGERHLQKQANALNDLWVEQFLTMKKQAQLDR